MQKNTRCVSLIPNLCNDFHYLASISIIVAANGNFTFSSMHHDYYLLVVFCAPLSLAKSVVINGKTALIRYWRWWNRPFKDLFFAPTGNCTRFTRIGFVSKFEQDNACSIRKNGESSFRNASVHFVLIIVGDANSVVQHLTRMCLMALKQNTVAFWKFVTHIQEKS